MAEQQKRGTEKTTGATEKTVHDLTKQEDLTRVLEQSLRALQEMEHRLQALEQELGSIGVRPGHNPQQRMHASVPGGSEQFIGAPNPHGMHGAINPQIPAGVPSASPFSDARGSPYGSPYGSPFAAGVSPFVAPHWAVPGNQAASAFQSPGMPFNTFGVQPRHVMAGAGGMHDPADPMSAVPGSGSEVSQAMQVGQPELSSAGGGTRTQEFAEMTPHVKQAVMDVVDRSNEFLIHWELPGVKKENLDIMVTDKSLILNAKSFPELEEGIVVHSERPPAVYRRTIPFKTEVDTSKAKANLKDGVLTVHVPKNSPSSGPKRLDVAYG